MKRKVCHVYLFRHGQTHFNRAKRFTGWLDSDWTAAGEANARAVARRLSRKRIAVGFCTRLKRSRRTLREVLRHHPECVGTFIDDRIIERCYGELQGQSHAAFIRRHGRALFDKYHRAYDFPPQRGESVQMVEGRVRAFIKDLLSFIRKYKVDVAVSAHGNSMRPFRRYFERVSTASMMRWEMPYDDYFEYKVEVPAGPAPKLNRSSWKAVRLPRHVTLASDRRNVLKKYY